MEWLKRLFVRDGQTELAFGDLEGWLQKKREPYLKSFSSNAAHICKEIKKTKEKLAEDLDLLEHAEAKEEIHPRLLTSGETNRDIFVRQMRSFLDQIEVPISHEYAHMLRFQEGLLEALSNNTKKTFKNHQYVQFVFDEVREVVADVRDLEALLHEIKKPIEGNERMLASIEDSYRCLRDITDAEKEGVRLAKAREAAKKQQGALGTEMASHEDALETIKSGSGYANLREIEKALSLAEDAKQEAIDQVETEFAPLAKARKRYRQMVESGRHVASEDMLNICSSPPDLLSGKVEPAQALLEDLERLVLKGDIKLKDKQRAIVLNRLERLHRDFLDGALKAYLQAEGDEKRLKGELGEITLHQEMAALKRKIERAQEARAESSSLIENIDKQGAAIIRRLEADKKRLERLVSGLEGHEVRLVF